jgi:hypothetical protein
MHRTTAPLPCPLPTSNADSVINREIILAQKQASLGNWSRCSLSSSSASFSCGSSTALLAWIRFSEQPVLESQSVIPQDRPRLQPFLFRSFFCRVELCLIFSGLFHLSAFLSLAVTDTLIHFIFN